jgi:hypothetical protein
MRSPVFTVVSIFGSDTAAAKITIKHGPIPKLDMDVGMTLVLLACRKQEARQPEDSPTMTAEHCDPMSLSMMRRAPPAFGARVGLN